MVYPLLMQLWHLLTPDWQDALQKVQSDIAYISSKLENVTAVNPAKEKIFSALGQSPKDFRVVLVGQDPYPDPKQAMGLAFSIPDNFKQIPQSLRNIQKEFEADLGIAGPNDLTLWKNSGVLLLNRILTCESGKSLSHKSFGWQQVTSEIVRAIVVENPNTVGVLWGKSAQELTEMFKPDLIVSSVHPSPLSANRTLGEDAFFGSKPFSRVNDLLVNSNQQPINWA